MNNNTNNSQIGSVTLGNKIIHNRGYSGLGNNNSNMGSHRINT